MHRFLGRCIIGAGALLIATTASAQGTAGPTTRPFKFGGSLGASVPIGDFGDIAADIAAMEQFAKKLAADVQEMRKLIGEEKPPANSWDFKLIPGGLVDLEFLLQYLVLREAATHPSLLAPRATPLLLEAVAAEGLLALEASVELRAAHAALLEAGLVCTLDRRARIVSGADVLATARDAVRRSARWV